MDNHIPPDAISFKARHYRWYPPEKHQGYVEENFVCDRTSTPLALMAFRDYWSADWGPMMAALSMASLPPIIFYFFFQKQFIRGLTAGALKG